MGFEASRINFGHLKGPAKFKGPKCYQHTINIRICLQVTRRTRLQHASNVFASDDGIYEFIAAIINSKDQRENRH